jgi:hypothetical protein
MHKKVMLIFLILLFASCAGHEMKVTHEVVEPDGSQYPDPIYVIRTIDPQRPIQATFYYSAIDTVKDLDGQRVPTIRFLDRRQPHQFFKEQGTDVQLVVRILNPRNMKYKVFCKQHIKFSETSRTDIYVLVAYSDMKYREFDRMLPTENGVKEVTYSIEVVDEREQLLISTGNFHYFIK